MAKAYSLQELDTLYKQATKPTATQSATRQVQSSPVNYSPTPKPSSIPTAFQTQMMSEPEVRSSQYGASAPEQLIKGGSIRNISSIPQKVYQAPLKAIEAPIGVASQVIPGGNQAVNAFQNTWKKAGETPMGKFMSKIGKSLLSGIFNFGSTLIEEPWLVKHSIDAMGKSEEEKARIWNNYHPVIKSKEWLNKPVKEQVKDTFWDTAGTMATLAPFAKGAGIALPFLSKIPGATKAMEVAGKTAPMMEKVGQAAWKIPTAMATTGAGLYGSQQIPFLKNDTIQKGLDTKIIPEGTGRDVAEMAASMAVRPLEVAKKGMGLLKKVEPLVLGKSETIGQQLFGGSQKADKIWETALKKAKVPATPENIQKYQSMFDDWLEKSSAQQWAKGGAAPTNSNKIRYAQGWFKGRPLEEAAQDFVEHQGALQTVYKGVKDKKITIEGDIITPDMQPKPGAIYNEQSANQFQQMMSKAPKATATTKIPGVPKGRLNVLNKETFTKQEFDNLINEFQLARKQYGKNFGVTQFLKRKINQNPGLADALDWWNFRSDSYTENLKRLKQAAAQAPKLAEGVTVPGFNKYAGKYKLGYAGKQTWIPYAEPTANLGKRNAVGRFMDKLFKPIEYGTQQYESVNKLRQVLRDRGFNEYEVTDIINNLRQSKLDNPYAKTYADLSNNTLRSIGEKVTKNSPKKINLDDLDKIVNEAFRPKFSQDPMGSLTRRFMEGDRGKAVRTTLMPLNRYALNPTFLTYETAESPFWAGANGVNPAGKITKSAQDRFLRQTKFKKDPFASGNGILDDVNPGDERSGLGTLVGGIFGKNKSKNPLAEFAEAGGTRKPELAAMQLEKEYYDNAYQFLKSKGIKPQAGEDVATFVNRIEKETKQSPTINDTIKGLADAEAKAYSHAKDIHYYPSSKSMAERTLNHWLISWPFSYNFKVGKEIGKILYGKALGKETGMLGASVVSKIQDEESKFEQANPDYAHFKEQYRPVIDAIKSIAPVDPVNQYVRLNPLTSQVLTMALYRDFWEQTAKGKNVSEFLRRLKTQTTDAGLGYSLQNIISTVGKVENTIKTNNQKKQMERGELTPLRY